MNFTHFYIQLSLQVTMPNRPVTDDVFRSWVASAIVPHPQTDFLEVS